MITTFVQSFLRATKEGKPPDEAARIAEMTLRSEYAGERVYVAGLPKGRRIYQAQQLGTTTMSLAEKSRSIGVSIRHFRRLSKSD